MSEFIYPEGIGYSKRSSIEGEILSFLKDKDFSSVLDIAKAVKTDRAKAYRTLVALRNRNLVEKTVKKERRKRLEGRMSVKLPLSYWRVKQNAC